MEFKIGDIVQFGSPTGEQTLGRVAKVNAKSLSVETTEARGKYPVGAKWRVSPSLCTLASGGQKVVAVQPLKPTTGPFRIGQRVTFLHFWNQQSVIGYVMGPGRKPDRVAVFHGHSLISVEIASVQPRCEAERGGDPGRQAPRACAQRRAQRRACKDPPALVRGF
jgi:hypothetical protein